MANTYKVLRELEATLEADWPTLGAYAFAKFTSEVMSLQHSARITKTEAARSIAGAMFISGLDNDPLCDEITIVAGDLESGQPSNPRHTWSYLQQLIDELHATSQR